MTKQDTQSGFTLIEILLYTAFVSVIVLAISQFVILTLGVRAKSLVILDVESQGQSAMQLITQTIRNASSITTPAIGTSGSSATIVVYTGASSPTIFDSSSGALRITEGAGSPVALTNSHVTVSGLSFSNVSTPATPGSLRVTFTLTYNTTSGRSETSFQQTFTDSASLRQP